MTALLNDISIFQNKDQICITNSGKTMRNNETGSALHQMVHRLLDQDLRSGIYAELVASSKIMIIGLSADDRARNGQKLLLSLAEILLASSLRTMS